MDSLRTGKRESLGWDSAGSRKVRGLEHWRSLVLVLTNFHPVPLHLPSILLVHGPHVTIKQARRIRDHVSTAPVERKEFQACHGKLVLRRTARPRQALGEGLDPWAKAVAVGPPTSAFFLPLSLSGEGWVCAVSRPGVLGFCGRGVTSEPTAHACLARGGACAPGTSPSPPLAFLIRHGQEVALAVQVHQGPGQGVGDRVSWCLCGTPVSPEPTELFHFHGVNRHRDLGRLTWQGGYRQPEVLTVVGAWQTGAYL